MKITARILMSLVILWSVSATAEEHSFIDLANIYYAAKVSGTVSEHEYHSKLTSLYKSNQFDLSRPLDKVVFSTLLKSQKEPSLFKENLPLASDDDWEYAKQKNVVLYAILKAFIIHFNKPDAKAEAFQPALSALYELRDEAYLSENFEAIAQVSAMIALELSQAGDTLGAILEWHYALPHLPAQKLKPDIANHFTKEFAYRELASNYFIVNASERAVDYAQKRIQSLAEKDISLTAQDYISIVTPLYVSRRFEEAHVYADKALTASKHLNWHVDDKVRALILKAVTFNHRGEAGDLAKANHYFEKVLVYENKGTDVTEFYVARAKANLAAQAGNKDALKSALAELDTHFAVFDPDNSPEENLFRLSVYARVYEHLGDFQQAYQYLRDLNYAQVKLTTNNLTTAIETLTKRMGEDVLDARVSKLETEVINRKLQAKNDQLQLILALLLAAFFILSSVWLGYQRNRAKEMAMVDPLTGARNRRAIMPYLESQGRSEEKPFCVAIFDMDYFKVINDNYGHQAGDEVLKKFSQVVRDKLRSYDKFARLGGEEFVASLPDCTLVDAHRLIESIRAEFSSVIFTTNARTFSANFSCGLVEVRKVTASKEFLAKCDCLLYQAKSEGRGRTYASIM